jgi:hypothetical protein
MITTERNHMREHLALLGFKVRDRVTGFTGVVSSVSFDLYGCVQAVVTQEARVTPEKGQLIGDAHWFDVKRLEVRGDEPVMARPDFAQPEIGAADKPALPSRPGTS